MNPTDYAEAARLAASIATPLVGVDAMADKVYGWTAWTPRSEGVGWTGGGAVVWEEPDRFNSEHLGLPVGRLWHRFPPDGGVSPPPVTSHLLSARVIGHDARAIAVLQDWKFRLVATNLWMVRPPSAAPLPPAGFSIIDLHREHVDPNPLVALAARCVFDDRFRLDPRVDPACALQRFLAMVRNAVAGDLARYLIVAGPRDAPEAATFFTADETAAGYWYTALVAPESRARGLGSDMLRVALANFSDRYWWIAAAVQNRPSVAAPLREGFRIAAVCYDFHRWRTA